MRVGNGRFFFKSLGTFELGQGIEAWQGFFVSARPKYRELMVNVNFCMAAFYKEENLATVILRFSNKAIESFVDGLKIVTKHLPYPSKPKAIARVDFSKTAATDSFYIEGKKVTVQNHFLQSACPFSKDDRLLQLRAC